MMEGESNMYTVERGLIEDCTGRNEKRTTISDQTLSILDGIGRNEMKRCPTHSKNDPARVQQSEVGASASVFPITCSATGQNEEGLARRANE